MTIELTDRQSCDVELLCNGGLSPLTGFMNEDVYNKVVEEYHLPSGEVFGLPIVMDTDDASVTVGKKLLLTYKGCNMAMMTVESKRYKAFAIRGMYLRTHSGAVETIALRSPSSSVCL